MRLPTALFVRVLAVFFFALLMAARSAETAPIGSGDFVKLADRPGNTGGGEFLITQVTASGIPIPGAEDFISFCLQRTEYIDFSHVFYVEGATTNAVSDPASNGGVNDKDPLDSRTAYLYTLFRAGSLPNYDYDSSPAHALSHQHSANQLQIAFWMIEGELKAGDGTGLFNPSNLYYTMAATAITNHVWSGVGNVRALNLRYQTATGTEAQDQLALVTPEPASLLLFGSGLCYVAARVRRQSREKARTAASQP